MSDHIFDTWAYIKAVPNIVVILFNFLGVIVALVSSLTGALINDRVSLRNSRATVAQGNDALARQRLGSN